ncbi:extended synaptotagmin-2 isoform X1 [Hermetia illucens]|uniref:extended synaptotagmin-2 isoform X1 n=2 Tax=Hermetia illucens TaxID=343691 RepID=UPI0018CC7B6A|nr:extended synaptotagmin-2 isoform X1 [Hermetia illucens]
MSEENTNLRGSQDVEELPTDILDMAAASKLSEKDTEEIDVKRSKDDKLFSILYTIAKKVAIFGSIYLIGYMGWSVAWLIGPIVFAVVRDQAKASTSRRRDIAKACATANEKDVIIAKIDELPAWVYFPDVERCEWVNKILKQVWPNANHFARQLVKKTIEPNIAQALAKYKLNGFKFDRIILGTIPPRIGGVKIYDKNVSRNEIIMDLDLFYASDCDVNFALAGMKGGIKDFQIHGTVRVVMKPLIRQMPLVGGLQIFFLNNPRVDFNLVGVIDLLDMPGLSDILKRVVIEQIGNIMVLPNKLPITLNDTVSPIEVKMPEPEGVLRIHVVEAKDLMKKDIGVLGKGKSDPYTIITVGSQEFRTQTIDNTVNPKWDYWCEAEVDEPLGQVIYFDLWDWDPGFGTRNDEALGRVSIEISNVVKQGILDSWIVLENARHGMLHIRLIWMSLSSVYDDLKLAFRELEILGTTTLNTAILSVFIDSAKNLPKARMQSNPDPYAILSVGTRQEQTGVQMRTDSPIWEQGFSFLVPNPDNATLQLRIVDQKTGRDLGRHMFVLNTLLTAKDMVYDSQPYRLQQSGADTKVVMALALRILRRSEPKELDIDDSIQTGSQLLRLDSSKSKETSEEFGETTSLEGESEMVVENMELKSTSSVNSSNPLSTAHSNLVHRVPSETNSAGEAGLGRILLSIRYNIQRQKLNVIVHKIMNIPLKDPANIPDPYVKLYLLPSRAKETKRKTVVIKDNCNPIYDANFDYIISSSELDMTELEVTVASQKGFLYGGSPVIGMLVLPLTDPNISTQGISSWYDLQPETKYD